MSNQRVNDMSNRNYNNYSIAKKTIAVVFLSLIGMLNVMAQTGTVNRTFIMTGFGEKLDTCNLSLFFEQGKVTGLNMAFNNKGKGSFILASISGAPNMYHKYKTPEQRINDFKNLIDTLQTKYDEWSAIAKNNKVVNYKKQIGNFSNVPILSLILHKNNIKYYQKNEVPYIDDCTPYFQVDTKGNCCVFFGWKGFNFERTKGYNQGFWTSYPIKEQVTENLVIFQFYSSKELQSLKDALNLETARQELLNKTKSSEEIDSLFK